MHIEYIPVDISLPPNDHPRSSGIHLSKVLRVAAARQGVLKLNPKNLSLVEVGGDGTEFWNSLDPLSRLRMAIGLAWEDFYAKQLPEVVYHPGELTIDGVFMTPDGEGLDVIHVHNRPHYKKVIHEFKTTGKSCRVMQRLQDEFLWIEQMKGYCKGAETDTAYLHALFLHGDHMKPLQPQIRCARIEFTQMEINQSWDRILSTIRYHEQLLAEDSMKDTE